MRLLILAIIALFLVFWVRALFDVFKRADLSGGSKALWAVAMLVFPFIGLLVYTMLRPDSSQAS
ncbi:MAG: PLDc N-terminal domain-containing protein [Gaiellaceae bacterium]